LFYFSLRTFFYERIATCRIIMNFVDCDDIEGIGENVYTMSDSSVLFDGDGEHILSCLIKSSRKKAAKKQDREDVSQVENTKKRKKSNSDANIQRKKKKKKKGKKKRKKLPSLFKAFKSALKKDTDLMFKFETIADNLQSQVNNLREKINKIRDERADKLLNIFQGFEERLNDVNERLDDVEDED